MPCESNRKKLHIYIYIYILPPNPRHYLDSVNSSLTVLGSSGLSPSLSPELGVNSDVLEVLVVLDLVPRPPVRRSVPDDLRALRELPEIGGGTNTSDTDDAKDGHDFNGEPLLHDSTVNGHDGRLLLGGR